VTCAAGTTTLFWDCSIGTVAAGTVLFSELGFGDRDPEFERRDSISLCFLALTLSCRICRVTAKDSAPPSRTEVDGLASACFNCAIALLVWTGGAVDGLSIPGGVVGISGNSFVGAAPEDLGVVLLTICGPPIPAELYFLTSSAVSMTVVGEGEVPVVLLPSADLTDRTLDIV